MVKAHFNSSFFHNNQQKIICQSSDSATTTETAESAVTAKHFCLLLYLQNNANHLSPKTEPINSFDESLFEWRKLVPTATVWMA